MFSNISPRSCSPSAGYRARLEEAAERLYCVDYPGPPDHQHDMPPVDIQNAVHERAAVRGMGAVLWLVHLERK